MSFSSPPLRRADAYTTGRTFVFSWHVQTKKDAVQIFTKLLRREIGARNPTAE